jgi:phage baseplate assembly protein W
MNPRKGSDTTSQLFENNTPIVKIQLKTNIRQVIDNYEPRADVIDVNVNETSDGHGLIVDILFNVVNDPEPVSVQVVLRRTR